MSTHSKKKYKHLVKEQGVIGRVLHDFPSLFGVEDPSTDHQVHHATIQILSLKMPLFKTLESIDGFFKGPIYHSSDCLPALAIARVQDSSFCLHFGDGLFEAFGKVELIYWTSFFRE